MGVREAYLGVGDGWGSAKPGEFAVVCYGMEFMVWAEHRTWAARMVVRRRRPSWVIGSVSGLALVWFGDGQNELNWIEQN